MALVPCPSCGARFDVGSFAPGKKLRCAKCKEVFTVPSEAPVPAAASKKETRTSFQKKASTSTVKAAAPDPPKRPTRAPTSKSLMATPPASEPEEEVEVPQEKSKAKLALIGVVVLAVGGGAFLALSSKEAQGVIPETYEQRIAKSPNPTGDDHAKIALWCVCNGDLTHAELHLDKALAAGSKAKQLREAAESFYWRKRLSIHPSDLDRRLDLAEWCGKFGLDVHLRTECARVLAVDKKNERALKIRERSAGSASADGGEEEVDWEAEMAAKKAQEEEDKRIMAGLDDWHKASYKYHMEIRRSGLLGKEFVRLDDKPPYAIFVEASQAFDANEVAKKYQDALLGFWEVFQKELGAKTGVQLDKTPLIVNVFASRAKYDQLTERKSLYLNPNGFIDNYEGNLLIYTWSEGEVNTPYLWHDAFHVLFGTTTRLRSGGKPYAYWVNEGLALSFEAAARMGKDAIGGIDPERLPTIQQELRQDPSKRQILELSALAAKSSADMITELNAISDKFERQKRVETMMAQVWSFVAYLLSTTETRAKLEAYVEQEWRGKGGLSAFKETIGDAAAHAEKWKRFVEESK